MLKKIYFLICFSLFVGVIYLFVITCKPVRNVTKNDVKPTTGIVDYANIVRGSDLEIRLKNDSHPYYIKDYASHKINFENLVQQINGKEVILYYIERWTPFTTDKVYPHISKLKIADKVLFNELIDE